jgi:DNA-binding IclR family transcriptional regulator
MQRTIDRITRLFSALGAGSSLATGAIAAASGLPAATCSRLLKGLVEAGWVDQAGNRGEYRLGPRLYALAEARPYQEALLAVAMPQMRALTARHPRSGAVLVGLRPWRRIGIWGCGDGHGEQGRFDLLHEENIWSGASGRLLVALQPPRRRRQWIEAVGLPNAEQWPAILSRAELLAALADLRRQRSSVVRQQSKGLIAAAVPLADPQGGWLALGAHHPGPSPEDWLLPELCAAAAAIGAALA